MAKKTSETKTPTKKKAPAKKAAPKAKKAAANGSPRSLVIVESPAKARTIERYLGKDFQVIASVGHVVDLPTSSLGVDVDNKFRPEYEVIKGKKKIVDGLKREARKASRVYLAPDPDREGEAIAYHIAQAIGNGKVEVHRAVFNEITKEAVRRAIDNPIDINVNLFNAQQARRILDRLVGYKISPLLWKRVRYGISAGRVQSVAMRMICEREKEIRAFDPEEYWTVHAEAEASSPPPISLRLDKISDKKAEIPNEVAKDKVLSDVRGKPFVVSEVKKREVAKRPFPPFITSTLQQEASRKLRYAASRTMRIAQKLYEGVAIGGEVTGLITYMRTDSTRLAGSALDMIRGYIHKNLDPEYLPDNARTYTRKKGAQDAHEAVRPTNIELTPEKVRPYLDKDGLAIYTLIWNRTVASQVADAKLERTRIEVPIGDYLFIATGSVVAFPGFMKIYEEARDEGGKSESESEGAEPIQNTGDARLPRVEVGETLKVDELIGKQHFTQPPPKFTEAGLIKELERQGIGRPSTYAAIISTIQKRDYAQKEGGHFNPTELGMIVTDLLSESFPQVMDIKFTALMEAQLDEVEEGKVDWVELLQNFYDPFAKTLAEATAKMRNLKTEMEPTEFVCEKCGSGMVVRWGRNGKFLACSGYPNCRNSKPIKIGEDGKVEIIKDEVTDYKCVNCGKPMVIKNGRRGRFLACSGYPDCKTSRPIPIGVKCPRPGCQGDLVERQNARGSRFYSCNQYPECRYLIGDLPVKTQCEVCNEEKLVAGKTEGKRKVFGCTREDCAYLPAYSAADEARRLRPAKKAAAKKTVAKKKAPKKAAKKKATKKKAPKKKAAKKAPKKAAKKKTA